MHLGFYFSLDILMLRLYVMLEFPQVELVEIAYFTSCAGSHSEQLHGTWLLAGVKT